MDIKAISAIIFDFDGVLVDSTSIHLSAWAEAYNRVFHQTMKEYPRERLSGNSSYAIGTFLAEEAGAPEKAMEVVTTKTEILLSMKLPPLSPGAKEFFALLKKENIPYGICSNAPSSFIEETLKFNETTVDIVIGYDRAEAPKPAPDGYLQTAKMLGVSPEMLHRVLIFEDSIPGMSAAVNAGMLPIGICTQHSASTLMHYGAALCYSDLAQAYRELTN